MHTRSHRFAPLLALLLAIPAGFLLRARDPRDGAPAATSTAAGTNSPTATRPIPPQPPIGGAADRHLDKTPPRQIVGLDLQKNGWTYNCMECHQILPARWHYEQSPQQHTNIVLEHGNNRFCLNCHHPTDRNSFVDYDGSAIPQSNPVMLCAKCHGTIHRDWKAGVHGRQNGYWQAALGEKTKLRCIQCHDPHSPRFKPMTPMAPLRYPQRAANSAGPAHATANHGGAATATTETHGK